MSESPSSLPGGAEDVLAKIRRARQQSAELRENIRRRRQDCERLRREMLQRRADLKVVESQMQRAASSAGGRG